MAEECCICLEEGSNKFMKLNCDHLFHEKCIKDWIRENNSCPICREKFPEKEDENTSDIPVPENNFDGNLEENLINEFLQGITIQEEEDEEEEYDENNVENNDVENDDDEENDEENSNNAEGENNINNAIDNFLENILMNHENPNVPRIRIISNIVNHSEEEDFELQQAIQRSLQER